MRNLTNRLIIITLLALSLSGCNSMFFDKDNTPEPSSLPQYAPQTAPRQIWSANTGSGAEDEYLKMTPATSENAIYTASVSGRVTSINKLTGQTNWQTNTRITITTGPAVGDGIVVVGCQRGEIIGLNQATGKMRWQTTVPGEVLAQPAIDNGIVVVKTINGHVKALSSTDGHLLWSYQTSEPTLLLRGASAPRIAGSHVLAGFANGHLTSLDTNSGRLNWQQTIAIPEGAFAIQRMIDIDADPVLYDKHIYAATYQGKITSLAWGSGNILWSNDISSYTGMAATSDRVYISDAKGHLWAFQSGDGQQAWENKQLEYRNISGPAVMNQYVVVGDGQGFLHWINKYTGQYAARAYIDNSGIYASPIVENGVLYALSNKGNLVAYRLN